MKSQKKSSQTKIRLHESAQHKLRQIINPLKPFITIIVFFWLFLLTLPKFIEFAVPCLNPTPGQSYSQADCEIVHSLDLFIAIALTGLSITIVVLFRLYKRDRKILKPAILTIIVLALSIITAYYLYLPVVEKQVLAAPIYLKSFWE